MPSTSCVSTQACPSSSSAARRARSSGVAWRAASSAQCASLMRRTSITATMSSSESGCTIKPLRGITDSSPSSTSRCTAWCTGVRPIPVRATRSASLSAAPGFRRIVMMSRWISAYARSARLAGDAAGRSRVTSVRVLMAIAASGSEGARSWRGCSGSVGRSLDIIVIYHWCPATLTSNGQRRCVRPAAPRRDLPSTCNNIDRMLQVCRAIVH